jgi:hypothetical protein
MNHISEIIVENKCAELEINYGCVTPERPQRGLRVKILILFLSTRFVSIHLCVYEKVSGAFEFFQPNPVVRMSRIIIIKLALLFYIDLSFLRAETQFTLPFSTHNDF